MLWNLQATGSHSKSIDTKKKGVEKIKSSLYNEIIQDVLEGKIIESSRIKMPLLIF